METKKILRVVLITAVVLLIPLVAMQFTDEVNWDLGDFLIIGALIMGMGLLYELAVRNIKDAGHRLAIAILFVIAVLLIWVELAVGIFT